VNVRNFEASSHGENGHRAQAVVRVVRHVVPPANILVIYFGATLRHLRGVQQSHQSGITQVCKELIAKDLNGKFLPGDRVFWVSAR
jgi:hypothetical protein